MNEDSFWRLIEDCGDGAPDPEADRLALALTACLSAGPLATVVAFAEQLARMLYRLDRREYGDGLSGDQFLYTRAAVVAAGREEYGAVLQDPARFVSYATGLVWAESLLYVPDRAYRHLTGKEWDRRTRYDYESLSNIEGWRD
ncbi:DUF4240 domain-containing protein [Streptomyces sp. NPDC058755]|uniref:DUF4240 domain-containing protein n=1 Tax=Streptomyces sp. NPDC058755 TaxID=3346624 RepID=UPI003694042C